MSGLEGASHQLTLCTPSSSCEDMVRFWVGSRIMVRPACLAWRPNVLNAKDMAVYAVRAIEGAMIAGAKSAPEPS